MDERGGEQKEVEGGDPAKLAGDDTDELGALRLVRGYPVGGRNEHEPDESEPPTKKAAVTR